MRFHLFIIFASLSVLRASAQELTNEDSLHNGLVAKEAATLISGYGEAKVSYDLTDKTGTANIPRCVLFVGHRFSKKISLFTELEVEDAKISGGEPGGEIAFEQMFLKINLSHDIYITTGLFTPRFGITNENHLPPTFNGNDRPYVETKIIPATWREIGIGIYGQTPRLPGLNWSFAVLNGLNAEGFGNGNGIREGRFEGRNSTATNLAITGSLLYYKGPFRFQYSGYYGGSVGLAKNIADTLHLAAGLFGTPVLLSEANIQYANKGFSFRAIGTIGKIPDATAINNAFANACPEMIWGAYAELGYDVLSLFDKKEKSLIVFGRYETLDLNGTVAKNVSYDPTLRQSYVVGGITWKPLHGVDVKMDYVQRITGTPSALPANSGFVASKGFVNIGMGYCF